MQRCLYRYQAPKARDGARDRLAPLRRLDNSALSQSGPSVAEGSQRRTAVVAKACATGSWTRFRSTIPAMAMTRAATQPSKNAFILSLPRVSQQAIYTTPLAASKLVDRANHPRSYWLLHAGSAQAHRSSQPGDRSAARFKGGCGRQGVRRTLWNRCRHCKFPASPVSASEDLRDIFENDPVLCSTLYCWKCPGSARTNRLAIGADSSRRERPAATAGLDGPDQYGFGRCAGRQSPGPEPARHAGRPGRIVQDHDGTGQVDRFRMFISVGPSGNLEAVIVSRAGQR